MNLDLALCKRILEDGAESIQNAGLTPLHFEGSGVPVFKFIMTHFGSHGKMPDPATIKSVTGIDLPDPPEPLTYYLEQVIRRRMGNVFGDHINDAIRFLKTGDPEKVVDVAKSIISSGQGFGQRRAYEDLRNTVKARWDAYQEIASNFGAIDGIGTPWVQLDEATRGMHKGELWVAVAKLKTGKCAAEYTMVPDPKTGRWISIQQAVEGKYDALTMTKDGKIELTTPSQHWDNGLKECLRLKTRLGNVCVATPDHPILTVDGWKNMSELAVGEKIAAAAKIPEPTHTKVICDAELTMLAVLIAEGCTRHHGGDVRFSSGDKALVDQVRIAASSLKCDLHKSGKYDYNIVGSVCGKNYIKALVVKWGLKGKLAKEKRIPDLVFALPNAQLAEFLGILWSCDGLIESRHGRLSYSSASEGLIDDVQRLLLRFGIVSRKRAKKPTCNGKIFSAWELIVRAQSRSSFEHSILNYIIRRKRLVFEATKDISRKANDDSIRSTKSTREKIESTIDKSGHTWKEFWSSYGWNCSTGIRDLISPSTGLIPRKRLRAFVEFTGATELSWLVSDDIVWDEVESVESIGKRQTYDLTVDDTHCFVAANLIVHNTWMLMLFLERMWSSGCKPLLVSMEMPIKTVSRRFDALHTCLPYGDLRAGTLGDFLERKYMNSLAEFQAKHEIWIAGNGRIKTPADIEVLCKELEPDVVLIDGMYLLSPSRGRVGSKYERVSMVVDELQPLAHKLDIPIMVTTQFNRSLKKKTGGDATDSIGYAYEIAQNADVLIGMFSNDDLKASRRMLVTLMEHREGEDLNMLVRWDLDEMNFDFIGTVDAEELEELQSGAKSSKAAQTASQITF